MFQSDWSRWLLILLAFVAEIIVILYLHIESLTEEDRHWSLFAVSGQLVEDPQFWQADEHSPLVWIDPKMGMDWYLDDLHEFYYNHLVQHGDHPSLQSVDPCAGDYNECRCKALVGQSDLRMAQLVMSKHLTLSTAEVDAILSLSHPIPDSDVIFLSASSSDHYDEMQAMFHNLHTVVSPLMPNMSIVLFDLGLSEDQRNQTESNCQCHVIRFPFEKFRSLLNDTSCHFWKPLIIRAVIGNARKALVYQDTSVRWTPHIKPILERVDSFGLQLYMNNGPHNVSEDTLKKISNFFGEDPCAFNRFPELDGSRAIFGNFPHVIRVLLEPWAKCALDAACMCADQPEIAGASDDQLLSELGLDLNRGFDFDLVTLRIVTAKLFNAQVNKIISLDNLAVDTELSGLAMPSYFDTLANTSAGQVD